ncbi:uncharacterized protein [Amphiura filiformis]|uniref:uncharacterized protein n=1 Tax=Amphiura filiformis TaxID=82378 RepID=UPI003B2163E7
MKILLIGALVFLLNLQYASAQTGITITCPATKPVEPGGRITISAPMRTLQIDGTITQITYQYLDRTQTEPANNFPSHVLTGFPAGVSTPVSVSIMDTTTGERALCTFRAISVAVASIACPDPTNAFAQNRLNPLSPNPASQVSFSSPSLSSFPNNANVQLTYRYSNFDVFPPVNNQLLTTIQSTQQTHSLNILSCGSNTVTVTATDNLGNTATCTFMYFRLCVDCPNPISSTQTSTSFARPTFNFPTGAVVTYTYTNNGQTIGTFQFNQATTHFLQGFQVGTNTVTLTVRDTNGNTVTCTYNYIVTGAPRVVCPDPTNAFAQNRLNPLSPNPSSQVSFNSPSLTSFPNNANVQLTYRYSNFDVTPAVNNQLLTTIQSTQPTHSLNNLRCGSNTVTVTATDNLGNTATCTFTYFRLCVDCPNPISSTQTSTSFARPTFNFPTGAVVTYTYTNNGQTIGTFQFNQATTHVLQGFQVGTNTVTLTVRDTNGNTVTCTYNYVVTGAPRVACPDPTNAFAQNRLNPLSPNPSSQVSFNSPSLTSFPNNVNVQLAYRYSNFDVTPAVNNQLLTTIQSTQPTHSLNTLSCGSNTVTVTATDNLGNTATCTFTYFRLCVDCPNPISSTQTSTSFARPTFNFPTGAVVTYTYTNNGQTIGTFQFNQATTHFLQGFQVGTNTVTLTVRDTNGNTVTCTYNYVVTRAPRVVCPDPTNAFAQNSLNPLSPNPSSQVSFNSPSLTSFPNNANVQLAYRYSNFDVTPAVNNQLLTTIQSTQPTHSLNNLSCGSNTVTVTATDNLGNTATCTFTYFRQCDTTPPNIFCPNVTSQVQCGQGSTQVCFASCIATDNAGTPTVRYDSGFIRFTLKEIKCVEPFKLDRQR